MMEPLALKRHIRMTFPRFDNPVFVRADMTRLKQIMPWDQAREVTFECEPGTLQRHKLETLRAQAEVEPLVALAGQLKQLQQSGPATLAAYLRNVDGTLFFCVRGSHADGLSWARLGHGLPRVTVWDIVTRPEGLVVAGTHGRGDWRIKLD